MGCCGGFIGKVFSDPIGAVGDVIDTALSNPVQTLAIVGTALVAPELLPEVVGEASTATGLATLPESVLSAEAAFGTGAGTLATDAALAAGAGASGTALGDMAISGLGEVPVAETFTPSNLVETLSTSTPTTDYLGTQALGDATTGAVGSTATPSVLGEFNPANISSIGIQAPDLSTLGALGGTAAMDVGTAGLTAEQLANANAAAQIGSNASSGLGYLGGAESLPSGTAGITGVTTPAAISTTDALRLANQAKNFFLTGSPTGALATTGAATGTTSSSGALPGSILDFTPHMTKGSQINLVGMPDFQETYTQTALPGAAPSPQLQDVQFAADGGLIQHFGDGGAPVSLDPRFTKGRKPSPSTFYGNLFPLTSPQVGMPVFRAKNGGEVVDHQPEFYSEGGLGTLKNRYVKGEGDGTSDSVPAMLANGEFVIPADVVSKLGNGSNDAGAGVLDKFLVAVRKHAQNHNPKKLPPDSKGPLAYLLEAKKKKA